MRSTAIAAFATAFAFSALCQEAGTRSQRLDDVMEYLADPVDGTRHDPEPLEPGSFGSLRGTVVGFPSPEVLDLDPGRRLVIIRTDLNQRHIVDLGPTARAADVDLRQGERIEVQGYLERMGKRDVLVANRITFGGQTYSHEETRTTAAEPTRTTERDLQGVILRVEGEPTNTTVLLDTSDGRQIPVNIGSITDIEGVVIKSGQPLRVRGKEVRIGDEVLFQADRLETDGRPIVVVRHEQPDIEIAPVIRVESDDSTWRRYSGRIVDEKTLDIRNSDRERMLVLLERDDGQRVVVDLGDEDRLDEVDLDEGDAVTVEGHLMRVGGRDVLMAERIGTEDGSTAIAPEPPMQRADAYEFEEDDDRGFAETDVIDIEPSRRAGREYER
jgi:hypothetical protein